MHQGHDLAFDLDLGGDLEAMQFVPFSLADDSGKTFYSGQIVQDVMRDPKTGTLSFCYRFENSPGDAVLGIDTLTASTFHGYDAEVAIPVRGLYPSGGVLADELTGEKFTVGSGGLRVTVPARRGLVLVGG